ncbi:hypothetical protein LCGC14_1827600 [marine sediment metagenome]|uniref:Uncharacterized protein n=1 Tax=marine sediment metagenome TaxID=412755 RepID=A0A0F9JGK4_9ZZZZ
MKIYIKSRDKQITLIVKNIGSPNCYGNYSENSNICQKCHVQSNCQKIFPPPKEPEWCNPD